MLEHFAANKGIGYGIAKLLASQGLLTVVAARNGRSCFSNAVAPTYMLSSTHADTLHLAEELGRKAVHEIQESTGILPTCPGVLAMSRVIFSIWNTVLDVLQGQKQFILLDWISLMVRQSSILLPQWKQNMAVSPF